jgi:hypothetical protein
MALGRVDIEMLMGSGTHDPFAPPSDGPILAGAQPVDWKRKIEPGYGPYPFGIIADVVGVPAVSSTGAVGVNPWDASLGHIGAIPNSPDIEGAQPLPIANQPTTGF